LFGGGFVSGCPEDDLSISARLAHFLHRTVYIPRYRLSPENSFPSARDDVFSVYKTLVSESNAAVILVGESAGGNLALRLTLDILKSSLPSPISLGLFSPWIDLTHSGDSHITGEGLDPTLSIAHFLEPAAKAYLGQSSLQMNSPEISPLFANIPLNFPPTVITSATRDLLLSDAIRFATKLREKNIMVDLQIYDGLWHVFEWYTKLPEAEKSVRLVCDFLSKHAFKPVPLPLKVDAESKQF